LGRDHPGYGNLHHLATPRLRPKPFSGLDDHEPIREAAEIAPDPGDQALLSWAVREQRVMVTIDGDFGLLVFRRNEPQTGIKQLKREWAEAQTTKKLGLMFDRHLPELVPIPKARPRREDLVANKPTSGSSFSLSDLWRVRRVSGGIVHGVPPRPAPPGCAQAGTRPPGRVREFLGFNS
jgi:hypothetical protein